LGFPGLQAKRLDGYRLPYLVLNFIGTGVLTVVAVGGRQFSFVLTNGIWAVVSLLGLARLVQTQLRKPAS
jgi:hypothetical protein